MPETGCKNLTRLACALAHKNRRSGLILENNHFYINELKISR